MSEDKVFLDVSRLPRQLREAMKASVVDMLGFYPWSQNIEDWCWLKQSELQMRIPLHTGAGYTVGCVLLGIILGEIEVDEQVPLPGDGLWLEQQGEKYFWVARIDGELTQKEIELPPEVAKDTPARLLLSSIKILLAKQRDSRYGSESKRQKEIIG